MKLENSVRHGNHDGVSFQKVEIPDPYGDAEWNPIKKALEEPLESVDTGVHVVCHQMLL